MSSSIAFLQNGLPVTTSVIISNGIQLSHEPVIKLIRKYLDDLKTFGNVLFETESFKTAGGTQKREIAILNEPQTTLLLTFFKNTEIVRKFKVALVQKFYELREQLYEKSVQQEQDNFLITNEQQYEISSHVMRKTHALFGNRNYSAVYRALKRRFRIPRYTCLLNRDYETALKFIDNLTSDDFSLPDMPEESKPSTHGFIKVPVNPVSRYQYAINSSSFTFNVNRLTTTEKALTVVSDVSFLPERKIEISAGELRAIKVLVYFFEDLFKPFIQWAEQEARRQHHPRASAFYDVWNEPDLFMCALKRIIKRNS